jgi:hypothetical protein
LLDAERRLQWVDGLESSEPVEPGETSVGSRFRETLAQAGVRATVETRVDTLVPPREIALVVTTRGLMIRTHTVLDERDGRTRIASTLETSGGGMTGRMLGSVVARQAQGSLERSLERLKRLVETS